MLFSKKLLLCFYYVTRTRLPFLRALTYMCIRGSGDGFAKTRIVDAGEVSSDDEGKEK